MVDVASIKAIINEIEVLIQALAAKPPGATIMFGGGVYNLSKLKELLRQCEEELRCILNHKRNNEQIDKILKGIDVWIRLAEEGIQANHSTTTKVGEYNVSEFKCFLQRCKYAFGCVQDQDPSKNKSKTLEGSTKLKVSKP